MHNTTDISALRRRSINLRTADQTDAFIDLLLRKLEDRNELERQLSAKTISEQNIITAFGIKGEGAHSKLVIEYVSGLVAENARAIDAVTVFSKVTEEITEIICDEIGHEKVAEILGAFNDLGNMPKTDAFTAELRAQGIDKWIESRSGRWNGTTKEAEDFAANLRAGRKR